MSTGKITGKIFITFSIFLFVFVLQGCNNAESKKEEIIKQGAALYSKYGCMVCHSLDGNVVYGPPLNDIFMQEVKVVRNGKELTVIADREYLKKAIKEPRYEKVLEYENKDMPITFLSDKEVDILVEYLVALSGKNQKAGNPEK